MQKLIVLLALLFSPALAYAQGFGSPNGVGFPSNGSGSGGGLTSPVGISDGGTGQTTKAAGFNALSPLTTQGDILYGGASGAGTRLAKGTALQILRTNAGATAPEWATPAWQIGDGGTGLSSFTGGDTLYYASGTLLSKLAKGTAGQFYQMNSGATAPQWSSMSGDATMAAGGATTLATVNSNVGSFTNSSITVNAKGLITAASSGSAGLTNPLTTTGDTIYSSSGTTASRLGIGQKEQVLRTNFAATAPEYADRDPMPASTATNLRVPWAIQYTDIANTAITTVHALAPSISGTATSLVNSSGAYVKYAGAASASSNAGWQLENGTAKTQYQLLPRFWAKIFTGAAAGDIQNVRIWVGLGAYDLRASDTNLANVAAFRYCTATDGTAFWRCVTSDNSSAATVTTTTVPIATSTQYTLHIDCRDPATYYFWINGVLVATHTTNLPSQTTSVYGYCTSQTTASAAHDFGIARVTGDQL